MVGTGRPFSTWVQSDPPSGWFQLLWDVLQTDEDACLALLRSSGGREGPVELVEGTTSAREALAYARALHELGRTDEARDVFAAVVDAAFAFLAAAATA